MTLEKMKKEEWKQVREIYLEAFPKVERKPLSWIRRSCKSGKMEIYVAKDAGQIAGFAISIPYRDMVMVDYLAVSSKVRSRGTGSQILQGICQLYQPKRVYLLIEDPTVAAENAEQRKRRKAFYLKNGFHSTGIFSTGSSGQMEILIYKDAKMTGRDYMDMQHYALGKWMLRLSGIHLLEK